MMIAAARKPKIGKLAQQRRPKLVPPINYIERVMEEADYVVYPKARLHIDPRYSATREARLGRESTMFIWLVAQLTKEKKEKR